MQTLNILDSQFSEFNDHAVLHASHFDNTKYGLVLLEQLQTSLDLEQIINMYAMEVSKYINFSGLSFKNKHVNISMRGSRIAKQTHNVDLTINNIRLGILTYNINTRVSTINDRILNELHQYLVHPLNNSLVYMQAMKLAMHDGLTGLGNRRYFDEQLTRAMNQGKRHKNKVGLIICDLDKFKVVNDTFGHHVGDDVLIHFSDALRSSIRDSDSIFRLGGDEFSLLVEAASELSLSLIERRILQSIANNKFLSQYDISCSLGMTYMESSDCKNSFFARADNNLYQDKVAESKKLILV